MILMGPGLDSRPSSIPLAESGPEILSSNQPRTSTVSSNSALDLEFSHGQRMSYENFLASAISRGLGAHSCSSRREYFSLWQEMAR